MKLAAFEAVAGALAGAQVRYLVAGGLAVNAHGYIRLTMDIDLVLALDADNIRKAFVALAGIGYQPVDIFIQEPFDFSREYDAALQGELLPGVTARFVSLPALINMKKAAGRPRDLDDIQHLQALQDIGDERET